jgi:hypothetical protein
VLPVQSMVRLTVLCPALVLCRVGASSRESVAA